MPSLKFISILLFIATVCRPVLSEQAMEVEAAPEVRFTLVDTFGSPSTSYAMPISPKTPMDMLFKGAIPDRYRSYTSWAIEVSDPTRNLLYQMEMEGQMPTVVHWDGYFTAKDKIRPGQSYYVRVLLVYPENRIAASVWTPFSTTEGQEDEVVSESKGALSLFVVPSGSVFGIYATTRTGASTWLPSVSGELRLMIKDQHAAGVKFEGSSTILFDFSRPETGVFYSDVSLYYRYRLMGAPPRLPAIPFVPDYAREKYPQPPIDRKLFGMPRDLEVGFRVFSTTVRGFPTASVDVEYARNIQGIAASIHYDESLWPFRAFAMADLGYSLFRGRILSLMGELGFTYERIPAVVPGLYFRYQLLTGTTASDPLDGRGGLESNITNSLIMAGLRLTFRI